MTDRRFSDDEVAEIFRRATEAQQEAARLLPPSEGLTLAELQSIGKDVGVSAELLADAARSLERQEPRFRRQLLGMTVGVGKTVSLGRRMTDDEWERLVVLLRDTFDAKGNHRVDGSLRQWTNGNLQILIEPTADGDRVRMRTVHQSARALMTVGAGVLGTLAVVTAVTFSVFPADVAVEKLTAFSGLAGMGVATLGVGLNRVRGWATKRLQQMDDIARRLTSGDVP